METNNNGNNGHNINDNRSIDRKWMLVPVAQIRSEKYSPTSPNQEQEDNQPSNSLTFEKGASILWCVCWNWEGSVLGSCGSDKCIRMYSVPTAAFKEHGEKKFMQDIEKSIILTDQLVQGHIRTIRAIQFDLSGRRLAAASFDGTVSIWWKTSTPSVDGSRQKWKCIATLEGHENEVKGVAWSPDSRWLATCGRDKTVWIWEALDPLPTVNDEKACPDEFECAAVLPDHLQDVKMVKWCPTGEPILLSCSYDETIRIWTCDVDNEEWFCTASLGGHNSTVWAADFSPDGLHFASVSDDQCIVIWKRDLSQKQIVYEPRQRIWNAHTRPIYSVAWLATPHDASSAVLATASGDRSIAIWTAHITQEPFQLGEFSLSVRIEDAHEADINCVAWNPKTPLLASCGDDNVVKLWTLVHKPTTS